MLEAKKKAQKNEKKMDLIPTPKANNTKSLSPNNINIKISYKDQFALCSDLNKKMSHAKRQQKYRLRSKCQSQAQNQLRLRSYQTRRIRQLTNMLSALIKKETVYKDRWILKADK